MGSTMYSQMQDGEVIPNDTEILEEFLAQVSFKRTTEIKGYSSTKI